MAASEKPSSLGQPAPPADPRLVAFVEPPPPLRVAAEDPPGMEVPLFFAQLRSLDRTVKMARLFSVILDKQNIFEAWLGKFTKTISEDGMRGLDPTKPLGLYARMTNDVPVLTLVALFPVRDEIGFRRLLADLGFREKDAIGDLRPYETPKIPKGFPIQVALPPQVYLRFSEGYAHVCIQGDPNLLVGKKLLRGSSLFGDQERKLLSATLRLDRLSTLFRKEWLARTEKIKNLPKLLEDPAARKLADKFGEDLGENAKALLGNPVLRDHAEGLVNKLDAYVKTLIEGARDLTFDLELNAETRSLAADLYLRGKKGSQLAQGLAALAENPSHVGALAMQDAAISALVHLQLPDDLRKKLPAVIQEANKKVLAEIAQPEERRKHERLFRALGDALAAGKLDFAVSVSSQGEGKPAIVQGGLGVPNGAALDRLFRDAVADVEEKVLRDVFEFDVAEIAGFKVHRANVQNKFLQDARQVFGNNPYYYAFRPDAIFFTAGADGKASLGRALRLQPRTAPLALLALNLREIHNFSFVQVGDPALARKHLDEKNPGRFRIELSGGEALRLHASVDLNLFHFLMVRMNKF